TSKATNLVSGFVPSSYTNAEEAYRFDAATQTTTLMSHTYSTATKGAFGRFIIGSISDDGRYVVFGGAPVDLMSGGTLADPWQVWLNDRETNGNILISHAFTSATALPNNDCVLPIISGNGQFVTYYAQATDLISGYSGGPIGNYEAQLYIWERATGDNL